MSGKKNPLKISSSKDFISNKKSLNINKNSLKTVLGFFGGLAFGFLLFITGLIWYVDSNGLELTEKVGVKEVLGPEEVYEIKLLNYEQDLEGDVIANYQINKNLFERCNIDYCKVMTYARKNDGYPEFTSGPSTILDENFTQDVSMTVLSQVLQTFSTDSLPLTNFQLSCRIRIYDSDSMELISTIDSGFNPIEYME